jgi:MFS family permease
VGGAGDELLIREGTMMEDIRYSGYRWYVLITFLVLQISTTLISISPATIIGDIAKSLNMSLGATTGSVMGVVNLVIAIACIMAGFLVDRFGFVKMLIVGAVLMIVPTLALPFIGNSFPGLMVVRIIQSLGNGPVYASIAMVAALWFPPHQRGIVTGLQGSAVTLGFAIGFVTTPMAFESVGTWQTALAWQSVSAIIGLILAIALLFGPKAPGQALVRTGNSGAVSDNGAFKLAMRQPVSWVCIAVLFCVIWVMAAFLDLTPGYFAIDPPTGVGYGRMTAGKLMMLVQIAFIFGSAATGFALEKVFKGVVRPVVTIGYIVFAIFAVSILWPAVYKNMPVLLICLGVAGFFQAWVVPNIFAFISKHYPAHIAGKLQGSWFGIGQFGGAVGVGAGATALYNTGNYHMSIIIVGVISVIGFILAQFLKPPKVFRGVEKEAR